VYKLKVIFIVAFFLNVIYLYSQSKNDSLLGGNSIYRSWWDVKHYHLNIKPDFNTKSLTGYNEISFVVLNHNHHYLQLDLQLPLRIDSVFCDSSKINSVTQNGNFWNLNLPNLKLETYHQLKVYFSGYPKVARNPPWDGGWVWKRDKNKNPWMSVACQGAGASIWYPCKDLQRDEPDNGAELTIQVPDTLVGIGNGKLKSVKKLNNGFTEYSWSVSNSINSYNIVPYIGKYKLISDSIVGKNGVLKTDYWFLEYNEEKAKTHLMDNTIKTLKSLEDWFGPYPFYEDSYKIIEAPYLGMEHQSNVAYGNNYQNGYAGRDLSKSGWGMKWDFIVVHESAHEWFGNSITAFDVADNWIHEGFASYAEALFTETYFGKEAGNAYCLGVRNSILNDKPIIGNYNLRQEGSGDMYNKGSNIIYMIRYLMNDDVKFKNMLNEISKIFHHQCITSKQLEEFIIQYSNLDLSLFFNQYLRTNQIPILEYKLKKHHLQYRFTQAIEGLKLPIKLMIDNKEVVILPSSNWQTIKLDTYKQKSKLIFDANLYYTLSRVK
jgi:aminopeptidase N